MGNIQSNVTKQTLADYTSFMNSAIQDAYSVSIADCAAANNLSVQTGGGNGCNFEIINGSVNIDQTATASCSLSSTNINQTSVTFKNTITNKTKQFIDQNSQNKQGWFATAFSFQINGASNSTEVTNAISNSFVGSITEICRQEAQAMNSAKVLLCGIYNASAVNINQNATVTGLVSCINRNVTNVFTSNTVLNQLWQQTDQKLASEQSGVDSLVFWIVIAIVVGIIFLLIIAYAFSGKKGEDDTGGVEIRQLSSLTGKSSATKT